MKRMHRDAPLYEESRRDEDPRANKGPSRLGWVRKMGQGFMDRSG